MFRSLVLVAALSCAACSTTDNLRLAGGMTLPDLPGTTKEGRGYVGRAEVTSATDVGVDVGLFVGGGHEDHDTAKVDHVSTGVSVRKHFLSGKIRPFIEGRVGYRHNMIRNGGDGGSLELGGGLGAEYFMNEGSSLFIQFDYSRASILGADQDSIGILLGGSIDF